MKSASAEYPWTAPEEKIYPVLKALAEIVNDCERIEIDPDYTHARACLIVDYNGILRGLKRSWERHNGQIDLDELFEIFGGE